MAVGAYAAYNLARPHRRHAADRWSLLLGGLCATAVGMLFGMPSLRIKGLYLAVATLAAQFFVDWAFLRIKWFTNYSSSGSVDASAARQCSAADRHAGRAATCSAWPSSWCSRWSPRTWCAAHIGREWMAIRDMDIAAEVIGIRPVLRQAHGLRVSSFYRRRGRRAVGLRLPGLVGAGGLRHRPLVPAAVHGDHRRAGLDPGQLLRRRLHRAAADLPRTSVPAGSASRSSTATDRRTSSS